MLDQVVEWFQPEEPPEWMTAEQYAALPATLIVRELRYQVGRPGFRTRTVTLVNLAPRTANTLVAVMSPFEISIE